MTTPEPILFCWSGGKDSAMALHTLLQQKHFRIVALLTTVTEGYDRIAMHGVRRELLKRQAESIGLPLHEVRIPPQCVNPIYEARMEEALRLFYNRGVRKFSIPASLDANSTPPSSAIFPPTPTLAAKTASSTPSSSMARFFTLPFPFEREKSSTAMAFSFAIY